MSEKEKYVEFKNKYLLFIDEQIININTYWLRPKAVESDIYR